MIFTDEEKREIEESVRAINLIMMKAAVVVDYWADVIDRRFNETTTAS